jgi:hypothetical protein
MDQVRFKGLGYTLPAIDIVIEVERDLAHPVMLVMVFMTEGDGVGIRSLHGHAPGRRVVCDDVTFASMINTTWKRFNEGKIWLTFKCYRFRVPHNSINLLR